MEYSVLWRKITEIFNYSHDFFLLSNTANFLNCCKEYVSTGGNFHCIKTTKL